MEKKVAIYARVSTQDNQEYMRQISDCTRAILKDDYKEDQIEIYAEKLSGYKKCNERPELNRIMEILRANPKAYDCIYVTEISRIGRNPRHTREIIDELSDLKVPVYIGTLQLKTIKDDGKVDPIVSIILQVLMEFAHIEAELFKGRAKSGKRQRAIDGKSNTNTQAYGYMTDETGKVIINPDEASIVEQIFQDYKSGIGFRVIANSLNEMEVPTKFNKLKADVSFNFLDENITITGSEIKWSDVVIRQMVKNPTYKGIRRHKVKDAIIEIIDDKNVILEPAEYIEIPVEPIVSTEIWDECNHLRQNKSSRNMLTVNEYLLKDLMRCGVCGRKYSGKYQLNGDKVYKCTSYLVAGRGCGNRSINISLIESVIYDQISNADGLLKYLDNPNDILKQIQAELSIQEQLLKNEKSALDGKEKQIDNLLKVTTASTNPNFERFAKLEGEIQSEIDGIKEKIRRLTKDILSKKTTIANYNQKTATSEMFENAKHNRPELRSIFKQFIDKIILNDVGNGYVLANTFVKVNGVRLNNTLKLFINANGVRVYGGRSEKNINTYQFLIWKMHQPTKMTNLNLTIQRTFWKTTR
ncbi:MAG: recombinase family protein [Flavobacterium sp. JAD_PAG50586_2]|nr:MAG: recombinase family protein [Flavobacterium sp. JAD_PAG50586_2]